MESIIIDSVDAVTAKKIKDYLKQLRVNFESAKVAEDESPYDPEFAKMVLERSKSARDGNVVPYTEELRKDLFGK